MAGILSNFLNRLAPLGAPTRPTTAAPSAEPQGDPVVRLSSDAVSVTATPSAAPSLSDLVSKAKAAQEARTPVQAREEAEAVWSDHFDWKSAYRTVEKDFRDVNAPVDAAQAQAANAQITANQELETQALNKLSPGQQAAYSRVRQLTEQDPPARLGLQVLLMEGTLTGGKKAMDGKDLLGELDHMATRPLHPAIDRKALVLDLVQEVAAPSSINQQSRASCIYTSLQIQMVRQAPAEYARLVGGFASPEGKVTLANGQTTARYRHAEKEDGTHRSISTRLWTTGLMNYGASPVVRKDPKAVIDADAGAISYDRVLDGLGGKLQRFEGVDPISLRSHMGEVIDQMQALTSRGTPVRVSLDWGEGGAEHALHAITLTGIQGDRAYYTNPWGTEESMSLGEFTERLVGIPHVVEFGAPTR